MGSLKLETVKKVQLKECIENGKCKLFELRDNPKYDNGIQEDIRNGTEKLNDDLKVRQESIDLLKGRLTNQITGIKETISKVLDQDISLAKTIRILHREQSIMITSISMAIGMVIGVLVEELLPGGGAVTAQGKGDGDGKPEDAKEWLRIKLKALASQLGRL